MLSSEILKKAQRNIVEHGWIKGCFGNKEDGFCMLGALAEAQGYQETQYRCMSSPEYALLSKELSMSEDCYSLSYYNDSIAKDQKDVVEVFNRAIALAKMKERQ